MGAFDRLFGRWKTKRELGKYFQMLNGYTPAFYTYDGGVYEMELTRACIDRFASHCSKLQPKVTGARSKSLQAMLDGKPNEFMLSSQFLYKAATLYETLNTVYIVPVLDAFDNISGYYPVLADLTEVVEYSGQPYLRYQFASGQTAAIELDRVGVLNKFLYRSDLAGENNNALNPTLQLLSTQSQGIAEGIKSSASLRFMATASNFAKASDLAKDRKTWVEENLGPDSGGLALFPNTYTNIQQINSSAKTVDPEQMRVIQSRVFDYFGSNEKILTNAATGDDWSAYYEGKIEPFALQLTQAMTCMTYTESQRRSGAGITWSSNRLQYMTNGEKLQTSTQLFDRGILTTNDIMDIWSLPHVEDGDKRYIRREYVEVDNLDQDDSLTPIDNPTQTGGSNDDT